MSDQVAPQRVQVPDVIVNREFVSVMRQAMFSRKEWAAYVRPENIARTEAGLRWLLRSLENQIKAHGNPSDPTFDPAWFRRISSLRDLVQSRLIQTQAIIDSDAPPPTASEHRRVVAQVVRYKEFAWDLCIELEALGEPGLAALRSIQAPPSGINALEWLEKRSEVVEQQEQDNNEEEHE